MKTLVLFLVALFLIGGIAQAEVNGVITGEEWNKMSPSAKTLYVAGLYEGFIYSGVVHQQRDFDKYFPSNMSSEEILKNLDKLYTAPDNVNIPVEISLAVIKMQQKGNDAKMIEGYLFRQRLMMLELKKSQAPAKAPQAPAKAAKK